VRKNTCFRSGCVHGGCVHGGCVHGGCVHGGCVHGGCVHGGCVVLNISEGIDAKPDPSKFTYKRHNKIFYLIYKLFISYFIS
jgi:hypothetical protein